METPEYFVTFHDIFVELYWAEYVVKVEGLRCAYNFNAELWLIEASLNIKARLPYHFYIFREYKTGYSLGPLFFVMPWATHWALALCLYLMWSQYTVSECIFTV
jgi:hypothetical protein